MKVVSWLRMASILMIAFFAGCGGENKEPKPDGSKYLLSEEPQGAAGVRDVRESAKDEDEVVMVGRIGGMEDPWVEDLAAFSIVDPAMKPCNEIGDDACPKPWDYC